VGLIITRKLLVLPNKSQDTIMKIAVLGAGMVGRTIAENLSVKFDVTSFDRDEVNLSLLKSRAKLETQVTDLEKFDGYPHLLKGYDFVVSAVPGFMGYKTLEAIINAGKNLVDISFFPENGMDLDDLAKRKNVTAIIDCGVAPGMSNLILGRYNEVMKINSFECVVGGLPKLRLKPFEYKAPFSPVDVIEEYTRPARYVENGHIVTKAALSDPELIHFTEAGTLESFNTDGLRSILFTMIHIPNLKEKTLRYPGHISLIQALQQAGFFDEQLIEVNGMSIRPLDFTSAVLFRQWKLGPNDAEFTLMRIIIEGMMDGRKTRVGYMLYDENDAQTQTSSMSRTTAFTCTAAVNMMIDGLFSEKGVFPPELVGRDEACFDYIIRYLAERSVNYKKTISNL
jgi:saccharopine dehydrogenase-like NADP-dependent oxidoreductase